MANPIKRIVVLGNTPAAWLSAVFLRKRLQIEVILVAPPIDNQRMEMSVAESYTPDALRLHQLSGLDEKHWLLPSGGSFQTAVRLLGKNYLGRDVDTMMPYSPIGANFDGHAFHHYAMKAGIDDFESYSLAASMARSDKFVHPVDDPQSILSSFDYAISFNVVSYTSLMVKYAQHLGVQILNVPSLDVHIKNNEVEGVGLLAEASRNIASGEAKTVTTLLKADIYIDASDELSAHSQLCEAVQSLGVASKPSKADLDMRLLAMSSQAFPPNAYKTLSVSDYGIFSSQVLPRGICYQVHFDSAHTSSEAARAGLLKRLGMTESQLQIQETKLDKVCQSDYWLANCIALGQGIGNSASVVFSDMEQSLRDVNRFIDLAPATDAFDVNRVEYNRVTLAQKSAVADYQSCLQSVFNQNKEPVESVESRSSSLAHQMRLFAQRGHVLHYENDPIPEHLWTNLMLCSGFLPQSYQPLIDMHDVSATYASIMHLKAMVGDTIQSLPPIARYINSITKTPEV
ncbi:tryptophan 7-halogenase [Ningiella sp. W23]|uniref:tryptophan 7-halogenase n=1 Tax=Ningiella sp. W23 TaxID=3023715 RepID=UPI003756ABCE